MANPVVHWEIVGQDGAALQQYYADLFDWEIDVQEEMNDYGYVAAEADGTGIGGGIMQAPNGAPSYLTIYVEVEDLEASLARAESLGGKKITDPMSISGVGTFAIVADPDDNPISIIQPNAD